MREKLIAVTVIVSSILILGMVMVLGKIFGKEVSDQQAYIQKHFSYKPIENDSEAEMALANFSPAELASVSYQGILFGVIVGVSFILILSAAFIVERKYSSAAGFT
jgi:hypothetical protein